MTNAALLVLAALALVPELCAGKKRGGVARISMDAEDKDVSEGYAGAVELGSAEDKEVVASTQVEITSKATTASISERSPRKEAGEPSGNKVAVTSSVSTPSISERSTKEAVGSSEDATSHKRKTTYRRQDDKEVSEGYAGAEDLPANDEEFPAIVGQLPQSAEELPGLKDVELVEELEEYILMFGVVVFFVLFGVFPALQQFRSDGKGGMESLMEMAIRFSIVQQAVAVLGLTHHLNGMMVMEQQHQQQQEMAKQRQHQVSSRCAQQTMEKDQAPPLQQFEPERGTGGSNIGSLLEEALADNLPEENARAPSLVPSPENNLLDSMGLIDTEEPLL